MNTIFTIIIPTYNAEESIIGTLSSIVSQNFREFEIVIIDGNSSDTTVEKITDFFKINKFEPYTLISEEDKGIYDAMNKGITLSKGEFLYFMGSDDLLFSDKTLEELSRYIERYSQVDLIYGNIIRYDAKKKIADQFIRTYRLHNNRVINKIQVFLKLGLCHQAFFSKKELFTTKFSLKYKLVSDLNWMLDMIEQKKRFKHIDIIVAKYNVSGTSSDLSLLFAELESIFMAHYGRMIGKLFRILRKKRWMAAIQRNETIDYATVKE